MPVLVLLCGCVSKNVISYSYNNSEIQYWEVKFKLNKKNKSFKSTAIAGTSFGPNKEVLSGTYIINDKKIVFNFKYSKKVINPFFDCSDLDSTEIERSCSSTLNFFSDSITTIGRDKYSSFVMKISK